jgi:hypothetical protein
MKIITRYDPPPIPTREFDWVAVENDYDLGRPVGYGPSEKDAEDDLITQLDALENDEGRPAKGAPTAITAPSLTLPNLASPRPAVPDHIWPSQPCLTTPNRASPGRATPGLTMPARTNGDGLQEQQETEART